MGTKFTNTGNIIMDMTIEECMAVGFGFVSEGKYVMLCLMCNNDCNTLMHENCIHYIPVLNDVLCDDCLKDFMDNNNYAEDADYQYSGYERISKLIEKTTGKSVDVVSKEKWIEQFKDRMTYGEE